MEIDFLSEAEKISEDILSLRRSIHSEPEIGNSEFKTAEKIEAFLSGCGIETTRLTETAVMGTLRGGKDGKTVAFRADIDALPVAEKTGADFSSKNEGVMHACGHDVHTASLLGAAKILSLHRGDLKGNVIFLFEPDEEGFGGAKRIIEQGGIKNTDAIFGAHISPDLPSGVVGIKFGKFYAASDMFTVEVHGKSSHGAEPEKGIDALSAAAEMVAELKSLTQILQGEKSVLSVGIFNSGTAGNIISDFASFSGIIRTLGNDSRLKMKEVFKKSILEIAEKTGTTADIKIRESYCGIVNHDKETEFVKDTVVEYFGDDKVRIISQPTMTTEDFGYFLEEIPGAFYHIGAGCTCPLHSPAFLPDDNSVVSAAAVHAALAFTYLK